MKLIVLLLIAFFLQFPMLAQKSNRPQEGPSFYFNSFQNYRFKNSDSALHYIRLLAADSHNYPLLQDLLHNNFAQTFQKMWEEKTKDSAKKKEHANMVLLGKTILNAMIKDSSQTLVISALPIYYWTAAQLYENNTAKLKEITNNFMEKQILNEDIFENRTGRYALMIYQILLKNGNVDDLANTVFTTIFNKLKSNPIMTVAPDTISSQILKMRSWNRYLFAYCNYILANQQMAKGASKEAGKYFLTAYDFSPDKFDRTNYSSYFYDMYFLLEKEKNTFQDDYVNYLIKYSTDKEEVLNRLLSLSLTDPNFKKELKPYYKQHFAGQQSFPDFWIKNINNNLKKAPALSLTKLNGEIFTVKEKQGKWVLLDFWGTWCSPCRAEHPDLQKFYKKMYNAHQNFEILTIACRDNILKVKNYMKEKSYNFPVAMSDNKIENIFPVKGYPSKFLITPQGNFLEIPFGIDWVNFIENYLE